MTPERVGHGMHLSVYGQAGPAPLHLPAKRESTVGFRPGCRVVRDRRTGRRLEEEGPLLRIAATIVLCVISAPALPATLEGSVTSPMAGVLCYRKGGFCADTEGVSVALTKMYLGEKAEAKLMEQIKAVGLESFDATTFVLTNGVACDTKAKRCTVSKLSDKVDAAHTKALFGGAVTLAEVADLNVDGSPEVYVTVTSAGSGSYGSLVAYAANRKKSLSEITLPALTDDPEASKGYMGHDEFRVVESSLVRRFPVYRDGDTNSKPTGGTRQISYRLKAGEAGWILRPGIPVSYQ